MPNSKRRTFLKSLLGAAATAALPQAPEPAEEAPDGEEVLIFVPSAARQPKLADRPREDLARLQDALWHMDDPHIKRLRKRGSA